ncbi:hypothetical protein AK812_SmicGene38305 [Symbiodinium microadriaticum]|uniref:Uncharacterized protein n=1 Tax=Symbiodinium microadriaticum TaxID=2951 RepID=A0A1Q9CE21_SYMMI|nr:hypothetical protein AK812_SmicGene38305 [Symbiodinium microadriaticum]
MGYDPVQRSLQWKRRVDQEELALCQRFLAVSREPHEAIEDSSCTELSDDAWRTTGLPSVPVTPVVRSVCPALLSLDFRQTLDMDAEGSCSSTSSGLSKPSRHSTSSMSSCPWRPRLASIHAGEVTRAVSPLAAFQREENARRPHTRCLGQRQPGNVLKNQHGDFNSQPGRKQPRSMSRCSEQHKRVT